MCVCVCVCLLVCVGVRMDGLGTAHLSGNFEYADYTIL